MNLKNRKILNKKGNKMANRNTYMPKHTLVKARRIRKVMKAILKLPQDCNEGSIEGLRILNLLNTLTYGRIDKEIDSCGDNHSFEFYNNIDQFEALEDKYIKAPKIALKGL